MTRTYEEYRELLESHLLDYFPTMDPRVGVLREAMAYSLEAGGKRIRPVMLLAACEFGGADYREALPYAVAIEYIHTYSLIHDDLPAMDNDDLRRGKPTNHKVFGEDMAILAGDALLNTAMEVMMRDLTLHFDDHEKLMNCVRAALTICKAAGVTGMIAGQVADVKSLSDDADSHIIDFIEANKTGALLRAPVIAGLRIAGVGKNVIMDFDRYAENLGKAFQISDDILDIESDPETLGKSIGKDVEEGKCNYAVVNGLDAARAELDALTEDSVKALEKYGEDADFFTRLAEMLRDRDH